MYISVIIPSFKPESYLWECLESLCAQTLPKNKFEVILILNGCCNPWKKQIDNWIEAHPEINITFIQTDTPGVSNARNIGLNNAKGEYIAFIDDDDFVSKYYLDGLLKVADGKSLVLSDSRAFYDKEPDKTVESYVTHQSFLKCRKQDNCSLFRARTMLNGPCMKLIRKEFIDTCFFDTSLTVGEDSMFMFVISKNIRNIRFAPCECLYFRRFRKNSAFTTKRSMYFWIRNTIKMHSIIFRNWIQCPWKYNLAFTISRILAPIKTIIINI